MAGRPPREPSRLGQLLVEMYCWSELSLPKMQAIAAAAVHDSQPTPHPDLVRLAKLGGSGDHPQNMGRDFKRLLCEPSLADAISEISLPIRKLPLNIFRYRVVRQLIILPHMLFATIFAKHRNDFEWSCAVALKTGLRSFGRPWRIIRLWRLTCETVQIGRGGRSPWASTEMACR